MEFDNVLKERRSVRKYKASAVTGEQLEKLIQAAQYAPSWKNLQTSRYYVIDAPDVVANLKKECLPEFNAANVANEPALIVTTFVKNVSGYTIEGQPRNECGNGWGYYDLGLASANIILEARNQGLDTLIMGIRDGEKIRQMLAIDESEEIVAVIGVGVREDGFEPKMPKRKEMNEVAKFI